ncbi:unnamed protein product [Ectocarpus sp. 12 AP-2014]
MCTLFRPPLGLCCDVEQAKGQGSRRLPERGEEDARLRVRSVTAFFPFPVISCVVCACVMCACVMLLIFSKVSRRQRASPPPPARDKTLVPKVGAKYFAEGVAKGRHGG